MVSLSPAVPNDSPFFEFPARAYLEKYYSAVGAENSAFMRSITNYLRDRSVPTDTVIEVAGGPSLYSLMAMMSCRERPFRHVTFTDIGWRNLREVEGWLHDYPQQFDYQPLLTWLQDEVGADPERIKSSLRSSTWELVNFDWRERPPSSWQRAHDVVSCHFFAESATSDEAELVEFLGKLGSLGRPNATLLLSLMCKSKGYTIGHKEFPAFSIDEHNVFGYLEKAGLELDDVEVTTIPCEDPSTHPGYDSLVFIGGRLRS